MAGHGPMDAGGEGAVRGGGGAAGSIGAVHGGTVMRWGGGGGITASRWWSRSRRARRRSGGVALVRAWWWVEHGDGRGSGAGVEEVDWTGGRTRAVWGGWGGKKKGTGISALLRMGVRRQ